MGDIERSCALLVGRILNSVAQGVAFDTEEEHYGAAFLATPLLGNGLGKDYSTVGTLL